MKQSSKKITLAGSTLVAATLFSFGWSAQSGISLSIDKAEARVGRPLTPVSVAGVARRQTRRAVYGAGVVGAGAAAVGTAAAIGTVGAVAATSPNRTVGAVAATSPNWGWGGNPYQTGTGYYGGSAGGAQAAYYGGTPSAASIGTTPHYAVRAYYAGGPWYGYSGWDDYQARSGIRCRPGTMTKLDDGQMYACQ